MKHQKKAVVIGAGIAGIAASIRLAHAGFQVTVLEANSYAGGKLTTISDKGYRFDAGPSLFTMPQLIEDLFKLTQKDIKHYFEYIKLPDICRYFYEDGTQLTAWADKKRFAAEVQEKLGEPADKILSFLQSSAEKYDLVGELFLTKSMHQFSTFFNVKAFKAYLKLPFLGLFSTMNAANEATFRSTKTVQLFNRYATYNGSNPYETPALMNVIPHLEYNIGAFFPKNGMYGITQAVVQLAKDLGVTFIFNEKVEKIITKNQQAIGVKTATQSYYADVIVCNMDMVNAYKTILKDEKQPEKLLKQPKSSSALIFYWGIERNFPELLLHNIFFSENYKAEFDAIFKQKTIYKDPTVYINISSKHAPLDAPQGCENWFVMINVPNNEGQNWDKLISESRTTILKKISRNLKTDIEPLIATEQILEPRTIELRTSSAQGALYGNSANNRYAAFLRHANYSPYLKRLYFCGGSVHPGGGIPLALLSAKIATDFIQKDIN
jgi:phytoene desaturase